MGELEAAPGEAAHFAGTVGLVVLDGASVAVVVEERTQEVAEGIWAGFAHAWMLPLPPNS